MISKIRGKFVEKIERKRNAYFYVWNQIFKRSSKLNAADKSGKYDCVSQSNSKKTEEKEKEEEEEEER